MTICRHNDYLLLACLSLRTIKIIRKRVERSVEAMSVEVKSPSFCAQCRSRCGCTVVTQNGKLNRIEPLHSHPSGEKLCPKGLATPELIYHADRVTQPLRRTSPKGQGKTSWEPISWDEAMSQIAAKMSDIRDQHGPEQVAFSVTTPSGTQISDGIAWIERLIRGFGSPNTIYATEICNWHKDVASRFTYGTDIGTPDFANTDCVLLWGNNPTATWLARSGEVQKAVKRGAKLIVVDPRPIPFARRADIWLRVKPGTDQVLALGLAHLIIQSDRFDHEFAKLWTNGPFLVRDDTGDFLRESDLTEQGSNTVLLAARSRNDESLRYDVEMGNWLDRPDEVELFASREITTPNGTLSAQSAMKIFADTAAQFPAERVAKITGVDPSSLQHAADILAASPTVAYYAWNGVGQSLTATQTDRAISTLYALTGNYGSKGGNVPGTAAPFADISGHELLDDQQRAKAIGLAERPLGPGRTGWVTARDVYRAVIDKDPYPVRMLFSFGTNLLASQPDTDRAKQAFEQLEFHVHIDFFVNSSAEYADIVLPAATSWEREGLRTGFDVSLEGQRRVQLRPPAIEPIGEARSDTRIAIDLATRLGMSEQFFGGDADRGHDHMLKPAGLSVGQLREKPEGIVLSSEVPLRSFAATDGSGNPTGFPTPTKRIEIYSEQLKAQGYPPVPSLDDDVFTPRSKELPLQLSCAKTVAFCHSQHRNLASLRRLMPDPIVEVPKDVADDRAIESNDWVKVTTTAGAFVARCKVVANLEPGSVFAQHGWWATGPDGSPYDSRNPLAANVNGAIDTSRSDPISGSIPLRCTACEVTKLA